MTDASFSIHDGSTDEPDELNEHVHDPGDPDGIIAEEQREQWRETHPTPPETPPAAYKPKRRWPNILIVIIVIVAAGYGAYLLGNHEGAKTQHMSQQQTTTQKKPQTNPNATEQYTSSNYSLSFTHLDSWTVNDTTAKMTVTSPAIELPTVTGAKTSVHAVVTMQNPVTSIPGFPANGAVASLTSQNLTYAHPSSTQRGQTYVSYLSYTTTNGLDALYVTGNFGYQQGQVVPMSNVVQGNPLISAMLESCANNTCTNGKPVTIKASSWESTTVSKDVTNLIESIVVQD